MKPPSSNASVVVSARKAVAYVRRSTDRQDQSIGDQLEALGVELVGQRLALGHRCAHLLGALLELPADAAGVGRLLAAVPGEALDADRCNASRQPNRSTRATRTPARDAARAAARPPGPDPTTSTSVSWMTSISRLGSARSTASRRFAPSFPGCASRYWLVPATCSIMKRPRRLRGS